MPQLAFLLIILCSICVSIIDENAATKRSIMIITAIQDNGCSKQAQIEIKQTKSNADVHNYAALSTSY